MLAPLDPNRLALVARLSRDVSDRILDRTERTNAHRVREAEALLVGFHAMTGVDPSPDADGPETALCDLLAHLMHYADAHGLNFTECVYRAAGYHGDEVSDEAGPDEPDLAERHEAEQDEITAAWQARNEPHMPRPHAPHAPRWYVTKTWDDWPEGGSFNTIVQADTYGDAEHAAIWEMAQSRADEREDGCDEAYIIGIYGHEWHTVDCFTVDGFIQNNREATNA